MLPALFFEFLGRWHRGELPFDYQDQNMDPATARAFFAAADPLAAFAADPILWGPLANNGQLLAALRQQQRAVQAFVKGAGHA